MNEKCHYCGQLYPVPVSYHHTEEECTKTIREQSTPTPRTDAQRFYAFLNDQGRYVVDADLASELEQTVAQWRETADRAVEQRNASEAAVIKLEQENARLRADAERYRGMRALASKAAMMGEGEFWTIPVTLRGDTFDAAIDVALKKEQTGG